MGRGLEMDIIFKGSKFLLTASLLILLTVAWRYPDDPNQTLQHILQQRVIKLGACEAIENHGTDKEILLEEEKLLAELAKSLDATIQKSIDTQDNLYRGLEEGVFDIVSCSIQDSTPWKDKVALTTSYAQRQHIRGNTIHYVFALPAGENAWLQTVNQFIYQQRDNAHVAYH